MRSKKEIEKMYEENERLVSITVNRRFSNSRYIQHHMLTRDDLLQYGRIGLYNACRTYDSSKGALFQNHAIRCIIGSIMNESKKDSLRNESNFSNTLIDSLSMDTPIHSEEGEYTISDILEDERNHFYKIEERELIEDIEREISPRIAKMVRLRLEENTYEQISKKLGISRQAVSQEIKKHRSRIRKLL